ncbi:hypothetical protein Ocin01_05449 [Orchesella cincta]|uniref:Uncharacterized protein n=1 Tax=Orchesella cincta TaxID=48709 RepID=A0A1D2N7J2_ORCCI|nr:hypothetical protein Ocin01_05449 [Orchesella cincta]
MACFFQNSSFFLLMITIACFILFSPVSSEETVDQNLEGELEIDPFSVREEGCPIIIERNGLDLNRLNGSWKMPYSSLNWIADIGMALYNHSVKMSHIMTICPTIQIQRRASTKEDNSTWILVWKCPKLHGRF